MKALASDSGGGSFPMTGAYLAMAQDKPAR